MHKAKLLSYEEFLTAGLIDVAIASGENSHTWKTTWWDILGSAMMTDDEDILYNAYVAWFKKTYEVNREL